MKQLLDPPGLINLRSMTLINTLLI